MNLAMIGTGYVGLVSAACFADFGHEVHCVDTDQARIDGLRRGEVPFFEPGLSEMVQRHAAAGRLHFTTDTAEAVRSALVVVLAVGTPQANNGEADLSQIEAAVREVARRVDGYCVMVTKSTVPVGTGAWIRTIVQEEAQPGVTIDIVSNPEFLREGSAIEDFMRPDRVVIGTSSQPASAIMRDIYRPLSVLETPVIVTTIETAEMIKYASNAFLAVKIGFINEIANLCDRACADVHVVATGMGLDKRIGPRFLHPGPGYGGSCFPKDTHALAAIGARRGVRQRIVEAAIEVNAGQRDVVLAKLDQATGGVAGHTIAVLGLAFKANTSDVRESPAIDVCRRLVAAGARVRAYDPVAREEAGRALEACGGAVEYAADAFDAAAGSDALVVMTEWNEFGGLDLDRLRAAMHVPAIVDARNAIDPHRARSNGFTYVGMGRGA
jgi:UDPglucose 6-dehydrogenase